VQLAEKMVFKNKKLKSINMDTQQQDDMLWKLARKRAGFKWSFAAYIFMSVLFTGLWFFSSGSNNYFWPGWILFWWGIGVAYQYVDAYHSNTFFSVKAEYENLKKQN
jgi:hypothetical protein